MIIEIEKYPYESALGVFEINCRAVIADEHGELYSSGTSIKEIPHDLQDEESCLRQVGKLFYRSHFGPVFNRELSLSPTQIQAFMKILGVSVSQFAKLLGMERGSLSNILNGNRLMKSSNQFLAMERLGMELVYPGSVKKILESGSSPLLSNIE